MASHGVGKMAAGCGALTSRPRHAKPFTMHWRSQKFSLICGGAVLAGAVCALLPIARAAEKKPPKPDVWVEARTPHFIVMSDGGEGKARQIAAQFEQIRHVFAVTLPNATLDPPLPVEIFAAKDGKAFESLFPEFPVEKLRQQPQGVFISTPEKKFIGLRTNANGKFLYQDVYEQYASMILELSYHSLPPWTKLGLSDLLSSLEANENGARMGKADPDDLSILWESPLLPLDIVCKADGASPYYTGSRGRRTTFSTESWALVHYLLVNPAVRDSHPLPQYISLVENGADPLASARQVFGDLGALRDRLSAYVKRTEFSQYDVPPDAGRGDVSVRTLSAAEFGARAGDFDSYRGQNDEARSRLVDAGEADSHLAEAEEAFGYLFYKQHELDEAERRLVHAAELDPKNVLAYYYRGKLLLARVGANAFAPETLAATAAFEQAVSVQPRFSPAWAELASIYADRPATLGRALQAAQHAASLEPGNVRYQYDLAFVLSRLGRADDARKIALQIRNSDDPEASRRVSELLTEGAQGPQSGRATPSASAPVAIAPPPSRSDPSPPRLEVKTLPDDAKSSRAPQTAQAPHPSGAPTPGPSAPPEKAAPATDSKTPSTPIVYSMIGKVTDVQCPNPPQLLLTLSANGFVMHLHTTDASRLDMHMEGATSRTAVLPCTGLPGRSVRIVYSLTPGQPWDGEMSSIEVRSQP